MAHIVDSLSDGDADQRLYDPSLEEVAMATGVEIARSAKKVVFGLHGEFEAKRANTEDFGHVAYDYQIYDNEQLAIVNTFRARGLVYSRFVEGTIRVDGRLNVFDILELDGTHSLMGIGLVAHDHCPRPTDAYFLLEGLTDEHIALLHAVLGRFPELTLDAIMYTVFRESEIPLPGQSAIARLKREDSGYDGYRNFSRNPFSQDLSTWGNWKQCNVQAVSWYYTVRQAESLAEGPKRGLPEATSSSDSSL